MKKLNTTMKQIVVNLEKSGVGTRPVWGLIHEQLPYRNDLNYNIDRALYYQSCILNFPCSTNLTEDDIQFVILKIKNVLRNL